METKDDISYVVNGGWSEYLKTNGSTKYQSLVDEIESYLQKDVQKSISEEYDTMVNNMAKLRYEVTDTQKNYLRHVYKILMSRTHNPYPKVGDLLLIQYKVDMEFINRVLGDLYYTDEDKSRLNGLKVYLKS